MIYCFVAIPSIAARFSFQPFNADWDSMCNTMHVFKLKFRVFIMFNQSMDWIQFMHNDFPLDRFHCYMPINCVVSDERGKNDGD